MPKLKTSDLIENCPCLAYFGAIYPLCVSTNSQENMEGEFHFSSKKIHTYTYNIVGKFDLLVTLVTHKVPTIRLVLSLL